MDSSILPVVFIEYLQKASLGFGVLPGAAVSFWFEEREVLRVLIM